jgi:hypothetical protein
VWNDTQRYGRRGVPSLGANALTFVIVGVVVLINSVAWGIPLLTGTERPTRTETGAMQNDLAAVTTVTIPSPTPRPARLSVGQPSVPLPEIAPNGSLPAGHLARSGLHANTTRPPKTLYPRPERAPDLLLLPVNNTEPGEVTLDAKPVRERNARHRAPDLAIVSPYAPGVRTNAPPSTERSNSPAPSALAKFDRDTTLERAREIAQRAARRFAEMRARLELRDQSWPQTTGSSLLPLDARRSTASLIGSSSSVAKNAVADIDPELVRSPLLPPLKGARDEDHPADKDKTVPSTVTRQPNRTPEVAQPVRIAYVPIPAANSRPLRSSGSVPTQDVPSINTTVMRASVVSQADEAVDTQNATKAVQTPQAPKPTRPRTERNRRAEHRASRDARQRTRNRTVRRQRAKKVDGFRKNFHRQLVRANFFGSLR